MKRKEKEKNIKKKLPQTKRKELSVVLIRP